MERLENLRNRREKLIRLNLIHGYTQSGNAKINKYYACILYVRKQINNEECKAIAQSKKGTSHVYQGFLNPQNVLALKDLYALTNPRLKRVKEMILDPAFDKPLSHLKKDFSKKGTINLITKIKINQ